MQLTKWKRKLQVDITCVVYAGMVKDLVCLYADQRKLVQEKQRVTKFEQCESIKSESRRLRSWLAGTDNESKEIKITHRRNVKNNLIICMCVCCNSPSITGKMHSKFYSFFPVFTAKDSNSEFIFLHYYILYYQLDIYLPCYLL